MSVVELVGRLVYWNAAKGWGFLKIQDGQQFWAHVAFFPLLDEDPQIGTWWTFQVAPPRSNKPDAWLTAKNIKPAPAPTQDTQETLETTPETDSVAAAPAAAPVVEKRTNGSN